MHSVFETERGIMWDFSMIPELKNTPVRELIRALERDGFQYTRRKGSQRVYRHPDGRHVLIHYHHAKDTLPPGTL